MSDVKDMNKYYPPDFDPAAFHRHKHVLKQSGRRHRRKTATSTMSAGAMELRMLWPFSLVCEKCQEVTFVGTKFNSRVERMRDEDYLGIPIWRISGKCMECHNVIILRTDPKNTDYVIEMGGKRLFDAALAAKEAEEAKKEFQERQDQLDQIGLLEQKALNTAQELKDLEALEELKKMNRVLLTQADVLNEELIDLVHKPDETEIIRSVQELRRRKEEEEDDFSDDDVTGISVAKMSRLETFMPISSTAAASLGVAKSEALNFLTGYASDDSDT